MIGIHPETLREAFHAGKIPGYKMPGGGESPYGGKRGSLRFDPEEVRAALRKGEIKVNGDV